MRCFGVYLRASLLLLALSACVEPVHAHDLVNRAVARLPATQGETVYDDFQRDPFAGSVSGQLPALVSTGQRLPSGGRVELVALHYPVLSRTDGWDGDVELLAASAACRCYPHHSLTGFFGYDSWRGPADGTWGHNGLHAGVNYGMRLGRFSDWTGIGLQVGGMVGVYDWSGADYRMQNNDEALTQGFLTYGLFRKANQSTRWSAGLVQDWMINNNFSVFAESPTLSQLRGQFGYALTESDEWGVWGAVSMLSDTRQVPVFGATTWRPVDQLSLFWRHRWSLGADTLLSVGVPERDRLAGEGSLGDYIAYATANVPLNEAISLYTLVSYMHPSASAGDPGAREDSWAFMVGMSLSAGRTARSTNIVGQCWRPLLPVAANGNFFVDTNNNY